MLFHAPYPVSQNGALMIIKALDPTALLGASGCKHPEAPAMLAGQRRDYTN